MRKLVASCIFAAALTLPVLMAPAAANASCADRKMTGTVLGGVGGALIGNSIARGGGGAVVGGLGGAVLGHEIAASGCNRARPAAYYHNGPRYRERDARYGPPRRVYYDQRGNPVAGDAAPSPDGYAGTPVCHTEMQSYYDDRGAVMQGPVQICDR